MSLGLPDLDPLVRYMDLDPDPSFLLIKGVERTEIMLENKNFNQAPGALSPSFLHFQGSPRD